MAQRLLWDVGGLLTFLPPSRTVVTAAVESGAEAPARSIRSRPRAAALDKEAAEAVGPADLADVATPDMKAARQVRAVDLAGVTAPDKEAVLPLTVADVVAELPFHISVGKLLTVLADSKSEGSTVDQRLLNVISLLVEHNFLNTSDYTVLELWVQARTLAVALSVCNLAIFAWDQQCSSNTVQQSNGQPAALGLIFTICRMRIVSDIHCNARSIMRVK